MEIVAMRLIRWVAGGGIALAVCFVVALAGQEQPTTPISNAGETATFQDPAVPLIALPTTFASRREKKEVRLDNTGFAEVANINGPGCIRHVWFLTINNQDKLEEEKGRGTICAADEAKQVKALIVRKVVVLSTDRCHARRRVSARERLYPCGTGRPDSRYRGIAGTASSEVLLNRLFLELAVFGAVYVRCCPFGPSAARAGGI
jgi:hypothetical protein